MDSAGSSPGGSPGSPGADRACRVMEYGSIPGVCKPISRVIYGTLFLHRAEDPFALLDAIWASGCNAFDCAKVYGNGECEKILGKWIKHRKIRREDVVVITKGGCHGQDKLWSANISEDAIRSDITNSTRRLNLEHVDLFMLHRDDPSIDVADIVDMMDMFQCEGVVTAWGVSNWKPARLRAALAYALDTGKAVPVCDSLQFSLAQPTRSVWPDTQYMRPECRDWYAETGTAVLAWECLAKGFMAGKWDRHDVATATAAVTQPEKYAHLQPTGDTASTWRDLQLVIAYCTHENFDRRERAAIAAEFTGASVAQIALKYVASQPFESFVLVGTTKVKNWLENAGGGAAPLLSPTELAWLETGKGVCPFQQSAAEPFSSKLHSRKVSR
eukprot:m.167395 g.167395  ORF g.167395 m.167395 type:complete len:386 (-) comp12820_c0_seq1:327-1484(-)